MLHHGPVILVNLFEYVNDDYFLNKSPIVLNIIRKDNFDMFRVFHP